jgi:uncharacterized membrane protein
MELPSKKQALFLLLALCIAFSVVFAAVSISAEIEHSCNDENCAVCYKIEIVKNLLNSLKFTGLIFAFAVLILFVFQFTKKYSVLNTYSNSLIALKVRINS